MPSSHSGSSHSSSSHSGSSHSSSFSSHSSSSHSSSFSSHSGSSWGSSSGSSWGSSRSSSPSRHSGSSRRVWSSDDGGRDRESSRRAAESYRSHFVRSGSMRGTVIDRPRINQPTGFFFGSDSAFRPTPHYCLRHNYLYYPCDWTDQETGEEFRKGYYDENGEYYRDVAFRKDGKYQDVLCQCEYCDTVTKLSWEEGGPLICPQCGGTLKILSALDEYTRDPQYETASRKRDYVDYEDRDEEPVDPDGDDFEPGKGLLSVVGFLVFLGILLAVIMSQQFDSGSDEPNVGYRDGEGWVYLGGGAWGKYASWDEENGRWVSDDAPEDPDWTPSNPELFGEVIYLNETEPGVYAVTEDWDHDRELVWDEGEQSYYDADTDLWAWYNTDVRPALWQYWYEPISGDFGDYGWMEYEDGIWYIETDAGQWDPVPEEYDLTCLWHIAGRELSEQEDELPDGASDGDADRDEDSDEDLSDGKDSREDLPENPAP